jgi:hypothetical protein
MGVGRIKLSGMIKFLVSSNVCVRRKLILN